MMFSAQRYEDLISREGKEKLRAETLAEIKSALEKNQAKSDIEDIYFTTFVIQ